MRGAPRAQLLLGALAAVAGALPEPLPRALSAGAFNVSASTLKQKLSEHGGALLLAFSQERCLHCRKVEPEYAAYTAADPPVPLARVDISAEPQLAARYEATDVPAVVLLTEHGKRWQAYKGPHEALALAAYARSRVAPRVRVLAPGLAALDELVAAPRLESEVLAVGLFCSPDGDEADEAEELDELADALRAARPDAPVVVARATLSASELRELAKGRRWVERSPSLALWVGGDARPRAAANIDEDLGGGMSLAQWALRTSLPRVAWLTEANFQSYAATELPMVLTFVDTAKPSDAERAALEAVAPEFEGRVLFFLCDGVKYRYRKIALGLTGEGLPAMALNTRDEQARFPYEGKLPVSSARAVRGFVTDYLSGRLQPKMPGEALSAPADAPAPKPPEKLADGSVFTPATPRGLEHVQNLTTADAEQVLSDGGADVLLLLYTRLLCGETCLAQDLYFAKAAARLHELGVRSVKLCRLDLSTHALPPSMPIDLGSLPIVAMLPADDKGPPYRLLSGDMKPKRLLYFAQRHASRPFELPENPHLDREQNAMWHEQVGELPEERRRHALETLLPGPDEF